MNNKKLIKNVISLFVLFIFFSFTIVHFTACSGDNSDVSLNINSMSDKAIVPIYDALLVSYGLHQNKTNGDNIKELDLYNGVGQIQKSVFNYDLDAITRSNDVTFASKVKSGGYEILNQVVYLLENDLISVSKDSFQLVNLTQGDNTYVGKYYVKFIIQNSSVEIDIVVNYDKENEDKHKILINYDYDNLKVNQLYIDNYKVSSNGDSINCVFLGSSLYSYDVDITSDYGESLISNFNTMDEEVQNVTSNNVIFKDNLFGTSAKDCKMVRNTMSKMAQLACYYAGYFMSNQTLRDQASSLNLNLFGIALDTDKYSGSYYHCKQNEISGDIANTVQNWAGDIKNLSTELSKAQITEVCNGYYSFTNDGITCYISIQIENGKSVLCKLFKAKQILVDGSYENVYDSCFFKIDYDFEDDLETQDRKLESIVILSNENSNGANGPIGKVSICIYSGTQFLYKSCINGEYGSDDELNTVYVFLNNQKPVIS